jgi:hypothetical protein
MRCGATYSVTHATTAERAALDVYDVPPLAFGSYGEKLRPLMHALNRGGVLAIHDVGTLADGRPYIVRERVDGTPLSTLVAAKPLAEAEALAIMRAICDVLVEAHRAGVVHRSLVLEHVIVRPDGSLTLIDWGIADELAKQAKPGTSGSRRGASPSDDVYLFGVLMHRLLTWVPRSLEALWMSTLADDPAARPTMQEIARTLAALPVTRTTKPRVAVAVAAAVEPRIAKVYDAPRVVTLPGIAPPPAPELAEVAPTGEAAADVLQAWEDIVASTTDFDSEERAQTVDTLSSAPQAIVTVDEPEAAADEPQATAGVDMPTVPGRPPKAARRNKRTWMWNAVALAVACALPMLASGTSSHEPPTAHQQPRAIAATTSPAAAPAAVLAAPPPAPEPAAVDEPAPPPALTAPAVHAQRVAQREQPRARPYVDMRRVAAKQSPTPTRSRLVAGAVPAAATIASEEREREALLVQYQRVGHNLLLAKRDLGHEAVAEVSKRFQWIKLDAALSKKSLRQLMAKTLQQLQAQLDAARAAH